MAILQADTEYYDLLKVQCDPPQWFIHQLFRVWQVCEVRRPVVESKDPRSGNLSRRLRLRPKNLYSHNYVIFLVSGSQKWLTFCDIVCKAMRGSLVGLQILWR